MNQTIRQIASEALIQTMHETQCKARVPEELIFKFSDRLSEMLVYKIVSLLDKADVKSKIYTTYDNGMAEYILEQMESNILGHFELPKRYYTKT